MTTKQFISSLSLLVLASLFLPLLIKAEDQLYWSLVLRLFSVGLSFSAICFGFYLYRRFVPADRLKQKQTDAVVDLLKGIRSMPIIADHHSSWRILRIANSDNVERFITDYKDVKVRFGPKYLESAVEVTETGNDIYIPRLLTGFVNAIRATQLQKVEDEISDPYEFLYVRCLYDEGKIEQGPWGYINGGELTVEQWLRPWCELANQCVKWLEDESKEELNLSL